MPNYWFKRSDGYCLRVRVPAHLQPTINCQAFRFSIQASNPKKATMAAEADVERATGYVLGGVSPLGQKKRLQTIIDSSAQAHATIYVSAGRRGLEIELSPQDLRMLTGALFAEICY